VHYVKNELASRSYQKESEKGTDEELTTDYGYTEITGFSLPTNSLDYSYTLHSDEITPLDISNSSVYTDSSIWPTTSSLSTSYSSVGFKSPSRDQINLSSPFKAHEPPTKKYSNEPDGKQIEDTSEVISYSIALVLSFIYCHYRSKHFALLLTQPVSKPESKHSNTLLNWAPQSTCQSLTQSNLQI